MPPRKNSSSQPQLKVLTPDEQRAAVGRLEARIKELRELDVSNLQTGDDPSVQDLEQRIKSTVANIYGEASQQYHRLVIAAHLDLTSYTLAIHVPGFSGAGTTAGEIRQGVDRGRNRSISILQGEVDALKEGLHFLTHAQAQVAAPATEAKLSDDIFIVHGRDDAAKSVVAGVISRAGLNPVILHQEANGGRTIIEKFEKHGSAAGFAVVIATPDDVGGLAGSAPDLKPRARQNVIGEMFWFAGRLGREKVCALVKGDLEMPSDFAGVVYTPMDDHGGWKSKLLQELEEAGYENLNWREALK